MDSKRKMSRHGHNETLFRLGTLADDAQRGLERVAQGETDAIEGWLIYGAALSEGRALFPSDEQFGQWVKGNLPDTEPKERQAAMWAADNADQFEEARAAGNARTVRGIHAKWKEIVAAREAEEKRLQDEANRKAAKERAEAARKEAEAQAVAEHSARIEARQAKDDAEREAAEARAAQAAEAKAQAEAEAERVEAEVALEVEPEAPADPYGYAKLTEEALLDLANGLRADLEDEKNRVRTLKSEVERLKSELAAYRQDDLGRALGNAQREASIIKGRMKEYQANAARLSRQVNALKAEKKRLQSKLENQLIPLN